MEESEAQYMKSAHLRIPGCDLNDERTRELSEAVNRVLRLNPWRLDHRPLGNVMRARLVAYQASRSSRSHSRTESFPVSHRHTLDSP